MPIRKFSFDKIKNYFFKSSSEKAYDNIIIKTMSTSETPGYKWLNFFKTEIHEEISHLLGAGPTVKDVLTLAYQNRHHKPFTYRRVKLTRMDEVECFDVEVEGEWLNDEDNGYMGVQTALRHI